jgi:hypothetical protein
MKPQRLALVASVVLAGSISAQAHDFDPGGKIVLQCPATHAPRMADVARAVEDSHYWAPQDVRREMLALARQACAAGSQAVTFVPPADQRYGGAANSWVAEN